MERITNINSVIQTLKKGLLKRNPANPNFPMWTLKDLDKKSQGWQRVEDECNDKRSLYPRGYQGIKHRNLARENIIEEKVEISNPRDFDKQ